MSRKSYKPEQIIGKLTDKMQRLKSLEARMMVTPDKQVLLTDPDARSMVVSGRGLGVVGYNVQTSLDTANHLIVTHDVRTSGSDRSQLARDDQGHTSDRDARCGGRPRVLLQRRNPSLR